MKLRPEKFSGAGSCTATLFCRLVVAGCVFCAQAINSRAQSSQLPEPPLPVDPRPISQLLSGPEKALLAEARIPKKLVEVYMKISDTHLQAAFDAIRVTNSAAAEYELDIYNKATGEAGKEAFALTEGRRSVSKKVEQILYRQIKTLETIDRLFPSEREAFADAALKHAKQLRVQALNQALASGEVLKDPEEQKKPKSEPPKESPPKNPAPRPPLAVRTAALPSSVSSHFLVCIAVPRASVLSRSGLNPKRASFQVLGDYLTEEEDDHVRQAQAADQRVKVFMKIADRRIKAIAGAAAQPADKKEQKKVEEEDREWGAVPKVSRAELLRHYARAIAECMAKLEDAYDRNPKSSALPKALALLRDSTDKHLQTLRTLEPEMKTESEVAALREAIDQAETANKGARDGLK